MGEIVGRARDNAANAANTAGTVGTVGTVGTASAGHADHADHADRAAGIGAVPELLAPGFAEPIHDAQAVCRMLLDALSRPGRIYDVAASLGAAAAAPVVGDVPVAATAALLALCDYLTPVWLQRPDPALAAALRFHTGAPLAALPGAAAFAWVDDPRELPALERFELGSPETPEHSATVLIRVADFKSGRPLRFTGPGIRTVHELAPAGLDRSFWTERAGLAPQFPCGIDVYLICGARLVGLPRTTHVEVS